MYILKCYACMYVCMYDYIYVCTVEQIPLPKSDNQHCKVSQPPQIPSGTEPLPTAKSKGKNEEKKKKEKVKKENSGVTGSTGIVYYKQPVFNT